MDEEPCRRTGLSLTARCRGRRPSIRRGVGADAGARPCEAAEPSRPTAVPSGSCPPVASGEA
ncbi:MAG: hypothetical protein ACK56F_24810, partial [bacterium]